MAEFHHISVLHRECVEGLHIKPDGVYVDATLGGAGHSASIAACLTTGHLYGLDRDADALDAAEKRLAPYHFVKVHRSYLVNLHHVRRIEGRDVVMESGERNPISKGRFQQFYEQYIACVSAEQTPDVVRCPCEHAV